MSLRSRAFSAAALLTGSAAQNGGEVAAGQELLQGGTDCVGGLASASAVPGGPVGQAPVMMRFCSPGSRCVSPSHRMPPTNSGHGKYRKHLAERA